MLTQAEVPKAQWQAVGRERVREHARAPQPQQQRERH